MWKKVAYTSQEIEQLLAQFNQETPLSELELMLNRTALGIAGKILSLSKKDPATWDPEKAKRYFRDWNRECYRHYYHEKGGKEKSRQRKERSKAAISLYFEQWYSQHKGKYRKSADRLRLIIEENYNGTLKELAEMLGIHSASLGNYLQGNRKPRDGILNKMSKILNMPYTELKGLYN